MTDDLGGTELDRDAINEVHFGLDGRSVSNRGRVPKTILDAYDSAH